MSSDHITIGFDPAAGEDETALAIPEQSNGKLLIRRIMQSESEIREAVQHLAMGSKRGWLPEEIDALNKFLDSCDLTLEIWLREKGNG